MTRPYLLVPLLALIVSTSAQVPLKLSKAEGKVPLEDTVTLIAESISKAHGITRKDGMMLDGER